MKNSYRIISDAGVDLGAYEGETETEAIEAMQRDAGYEEGDEIPGAAMFGDIDGLRVFPVTT